MRMRGLGTRNRLFPLNLPTGLFLLACVVLTVGLAGCASISQLTVAPTTVCRGKPGARIKLGDGRASG